MERLREIARKVLAYAKEAGAEAAQCSVRESKTKEFNVDGGEFSLMRTLFDESVSVTLIKDRKQGAYNPFMEHAPSPEEVKVLLTTCMAECAARFETLPILRDAEILRNILYAGVWSGLPWQDDEERSKDVE